MEKPSPFKLLDFLTFGLTAIAVTIIAIVLQATGNGYPVTWAVAAVFLLIWARVVHFRYLEVRNFKVVPGYRVMFRFDGDLMLPDYEVQEAVINAQENWSKVFNGRKVRDLLTKDEWLYIIFEDGELDLGYFKVNGYIHPRGRTIRVGIKVPSVGATALEHELGHYIQGWMTDEWDQEVHHKRAKANGFK